MVSIEEAYNKVTKEKGQIADVMETEEEFVFVLNNKGDEACTTVNKRTGEFGVLWIWDVLRGLKKGTLRDVDNKIVKELLN